ncbi:MAG TPA: PQ-loop domain-containing transporter [Nitrososphaeraceae archaeon]|nr:PQ-loop domain-containing transporter [Nitrososphaeraceae archaeon]
MKQLLLVKDPAIVWVEGKGWILGKDVSNSRVSVNVGQIIKVYHTKRTNDVSRYLMILFTTGSILWIVSGILQRSCHYQCECYSGCIQPKTSLL